MEVVAGIQETELGALSIEVLDYVERVSDILNRIDSCMEQLPACYQGSPCTKLVNRYQAIQAQYPLLKDNLKSYSDDFITLIKKMRENDKYLSSLFQEFTSDLHNEVKINQFDLKKGGF